MLILLSLVRPASGAEVQFEGFYRARFRAFDTLSLDRENALDEGLAAYAEHRLVLEPRFLVSHRAGLFLQVRALDGVPWGSEPQTIDGAIPRSPIAFEYDLGAPTSDTDETAALSDLTLWRAWGEVYTPIGQFTFGRVPLKWGSGIWLNDGLSFDPLYADHGDTTDRVMWEHLVQEQFYLRATVDVPAEGLLGQNDDRTALGVGVAYRTEDLGAGLLLQVDHTGPDTTAGGPLNVFTVDASADITLGKITVSAEGVGQFGGGDLSDVAANGVEITYNDAQITAIGAAANATLDLDVFRVGLRGGIATGDGNEGDLSFKTFTFDRDYSIGMFLFEQPMPVLAAGAPSELNEGRDLTELRAGNAIANALFVKPSISRELVEGLWIDAAWAGAITARGPELNGANQSRSYGNEFQLGASYTGLDHVTVDGRGALFLPGTVYSVEDDGVTRSGYDDAAFGFQLVGRIDF